MRLCRPSDESSNRAGVMMTKLALEMGAPIINADNVVEYLLRDNAPGPVLTKPTLMSDYPPCPPPFQHFFIEFNYPEKATGGSLVTQGGAMVYTHPISHAEFDETVRLTHEAYPDMHWLYSMWVYNTDKRGDTLLTHYADLILGKDAVPLRIREYALFGDSNNKRGSFESHVACHTLAFMQCKNVERLDVTEAEGPAPGWCKRKRLPSLKYNTLLIDPNIGSKPQPSERKTEGDRSGKALHICRGHFMHCVNGGVSKGLFGKGIYGTFWVPSHVRGTGDFGRVIPTYNVLAPTG